MMRSSWDTWALDMCDLVSQRSKDPSTKVGAVILRQDRTVASVGYNGFPRGCRDDADLYNDKPVKYARVVHAEINAILSAKEPVEGYTLYVSPLMPCARCAGVIIQAGIKKVVYRIIGDPNQRWIDEYIHAKNMFNEAGVEVIKEE